MIYSISIGVYITTHCVVLYVQNRNERPNRKNVLFVVVVGLYCVRALPLLCAATHDNVLALKLNFTARVFSHTQKFCVSGSHTLPKSNFSKILKVKNFSYLAFQSFATALLARCCVPVCMGPPNTHRTHHQNRVTSGHT